MMQTAKQMPINKKGIKERLHREEERLKEVFKRCDKNCDGVLDKNELRVAFKLLGSNFPTWRAFRGMHHADANGDGVISESELGELVKYAQKIGYTVLECAKNPFMNIK